MSIRPLQIRVYLRTVFRKQHNAPRPRLIKGKHAKENLRHSRFGSKMYTYKIVTDNVTLHIIMCLYKLNVLFSYSTQ